MENSPDCPDCDGTGYGENEVRCLGCFGTGVAGDGERLTAELEAEYVAEELADG